MINSRKAIWADNLRCAHALKLPQQQSVSAAAEIYIVHS